MPTGKFLQVQTGVNYNIQVGAGGATTLRGTNSYLDTLVAIGGGAGHLEGGYYSQNFYGGSSGGGAPNASGGGYILAPNQFVPRQGNRGSFSLVQSPPAGGYGGGGAGGRSTSATGGVGMSSSITGSAVTYAAGGNSDTSGAGTVNTGNGASQGNSGGSGVIIIKYPSSLTISTSSSHITSTNGTYTNTSSNENFAEITCSGGHNLGVGEDVVCDFTSGTAVDGTYTVIEVVSSTVFRIPMKHLGTSGNVTITQPTLAVSTVTSGNSKISTFTAGFGTFSFS